MRNLLPILKKHFPFINERPAAEADFYEFCRLQNIEVVVTDIETKGIYMTCAGRQFIFLSDKLRSWFLRYVMFHEIGHHLFHQPTQSNSGAEFFSLHSKKKTHHEAEATAALLLIPKTELAKFFEDPEIGASSGLRDLVLFRMELWTRYKL